MNVIIGSRGSDLALWQANHVKRLLSDIGVNAEIRIIKTQGDQIQHLSFDKLEGKGFFTKEIEEALLAKEIDIAVHSHKDLPTTSPEGLIVAAVSERENPAELLLINPGAVDATRRFNLKQGAVVGTSSARRKSQMLSFRSDVQLEELRGNVPTRIQKLRDKKYDAILLAAAGVERLKLDLSGFHVEELSPVEFVPAPAQGVLAIQMREGEPELFNTIRKLHHPEVAEAIAVERKILNLFDGGCQLPLGAYCRKENNHYYLHVAKAAAWNAFPVRLVKTYTPEEAQDYKGIAEDIVSRVSGLKPRKVFITRDLEEDGYFQRSLAAHGFEVSGSSLITTSPIRFTSIPHTDWIFFSSKNAVHYFFQQDPQVHPDTKFAVIGPGTEAVLKSFGKQASFTGSGNNTQETGSEFAAVVKSGSSILFPQAKDSLQTIQKKLSFSSRVYDLYVYKTLPREEFECPLSDIAVFTSPSNVEAYFSKYKLSAGQPVISIGPSTARELERQGIRNYILPYTFDEVGLAEAIFSL
jgi:hydroxymethylbilane synthase